MLKLSANRLHQTILDLYNRSGQGVTLTLLLNLVKLKARKRNVGLDESWHDKCITSGKSTDDQIIINKSESMM